jgi:hypothetical protein
MSAGIRSAARRPTSTSHTCLTATSRPRAAILHRRLPESLQPALCLACCRTACLLHGAKPSLRIQDIWHLFNRARQAAKNEPCRPRFCDFRFDREFPRRTVQVGVAATAPITTAYLDSGRTNKPTSPRSSTTSPVHHSDAAASRRALLSSSVPSTARDRLKFGDYGEGLSDIECYYQEEEGGSCGRPLED